MEEKKMQRKSIEFSTTKKDERFEYFTNAKASNPGGYKKNYVCGGVFFTNSENETYNYNLAKIMKSIINTVKAYVKEKDDNKKRELVDKNFTEFKAFLEEKKYNDGNKKKAVYKKLEISGWTNPISMFDKALNKIPLEAMDRFRSSETFDIKEMVVCDKPDDKGLLILSLDMFESLFTNINENNEEYKDINLNIIKTYAEIFVKLEILQALKDFTMDTELKEYLRKVMEKIKDILYVKLGEIELNIKSLDDTILMISKTTKDEDLKTFRRLLYYLFPVDIKSIENGGKFLITNARVFYRREQTKRDEWKKILKDLEKTSLKRYYESEGILDEKFREIEDLLITSLSDKMIITVRKGWTAFLKAIAKKEISVDGFKSVLLSLQKEKKSNIKIGYGRIITSKKIKIRVYYEDGMDENEVKKAIEELLKQDKHIPITIELDKSPRPLSELFGLKDVIEILKKKEQTLQQQSTDYLEHIKLLYALIFFRMRLKIMQKYITESIKKVEKGEEDNFTLWGDLVFINAEKYDDINNYDRKYIYWDTVRDMYDYIGIPFQTITKKTLQQLLKGEKISSLKKNLIISFLKDFKAVEFSYEGLTAKGQSYIIVETPSSSYFYTRGVFGNEETYRNYIYEVYRVEYKQNGEASIQKLKKYMVIGNGLNPEAEVFRKFVENIARKENTHIYFITASKNSFGNDVYETIKNNSKSLMMFYDEMKMMYLTGSVNKNQDKDCYIGRTDIINKINSIIGIKQEHKDAIIIKPAYISQKSELMEYYHPSMQLFTVTDRAFYDKLSTDQQELNNKLILSLLAVLMFESDSFNIPYKKLVVNSFKRTPTIKIKRDNNIYEFPLDVLIYELIHATEYLPLTVEE